VFSFIVLLSPVLGFVNYYPMKFSFVADHFQYHASAAIISLFAAGAGILYLGHKGKGQKTAIFVVAILLLVSLGFRTWQEQGKYKDIKTLWLDTLDKNPTCSLAHNNLGVLIGGDEIRDFIAYQHFMQAVKYDPYNCNAYDNLGNYKFDRGEFSEAVAYYQKVLECQPLFTLANFKIGKAYFELGDLKNSIICFTNFVECRGGQGVFQCADSEAGLSRCN